MFRPSIAISFCICTCFFLSLPTVSLAESNIWSESNVTRCLEAQSEADSPMSCVMVAANTCAALNPYQSCAEAEYLYWVARRDEALTLLRTHAQEADDNQNQLHALQALQASMGAGRDALCNYEYSLYGMTDVSGITNCLIYETAREYFVFRRFQKLLGLEP